MAEGDELGRGEVPRHGAALGSTKGNMTSLAEQLRNSQEGTSSSSVTDEELLAFAGPAAVAAAAARKQRDGRAASVAGPADATATAPSLSSSPPRTSTSRPPQTKPLSSGSASFSSAKSRSTSSAPRRIKPPLGRQAGVIDLTIDDEEPMDVDAMSSGSDSDYDEVMGNTQKRAVWRPKEGKLKGGSAIEISDSSDDDVRLPAKSKGKAKVTSTSSATSNEEGDSDDDSSSSSSSSSSSCSSSSSSSSSDQVEIVASSPVKPKSPPSTSSNRNGPPHNTATRRRSSFSRSPTFVDDFLDDMARELQAGSSAKDAAPTNGGDDAHAGEWDPVSSSDVYSTRDLSQRGPDPVTSSDVYSTRDLAQAALDSSPRKPTHTSVSHISPTQGSAWGNGQGSSQAQTSYGTLRSDATQRQIAPRPSPSTSRRPATTDASGYSRVPSPPRYDSRRYGPPPEETRWSQPFRYRDGPYSSPWAGPAGPSRDYQGRDRQQPSGPSRYYSGYGGGTSPRYGASKPYAAGNVWAQTKSPVASTSRTGDAKRPSHPPRDARRSSIYKEISREASDKLLAPDLASAKQPVASTSKQGEVSGSATGARQRLQGDVDKEIRRMRPWSSKAEELAAAKKQQGGATASTSAGVQTSDAVNGHSFKGKLAAQQGLGAAAEIVAPTSRRRPRESSGAGSVDDSSDDDFFSPQASFAALAQPTDDGTARGKDTYEKMLEDGPPYSRVGGRAFKSMNRMPPTRPAPETMVETDESSSLPVGEPQAEDHLSQAQDSLGAIMLDDDLMGCVDVDFLDEDMLKLLNGDSNDDAGTGTDAEALPQAETSEAGLKNAEAEAGLRKLRQKQDKEKVISKVLQSRQPPRQARQRAEEKQTGKTQVLKKVSKPKPTRRVRHSSDEDEMSVTVVPKGGKKVFGPQNRDIQRKLTSLGPVARAMCISGTGIDSVGSRVGLFDTVRLSLQEHVEHQSMLAPRYRSIAGPTLPETSDHTYNDTVKFMQAIADFETDYKMELGRPRRPDPADANLFQYVMDRVTDFESPTSFKVRLATATKRPKNRKSRPPFHPIFNNEAAAHLQGATAERVNLSIAHWREQQKSRPRSPTPDEPLTPFAPPLEFVYTNRILYPPTIVPERLAGCGCSGNCADNPNCLCRARQARASGLLDEKSFRSRRVDFAYKDGRVVDAVRHTQEPIYECGADCSCDSECSNRVFGNGGKAPLEIFWAGHRGWGIRLCAEAKAPLQPGTAIGIYAGELITLEQASVREKLCEELLRTYVYDLDSWHIPVDISDELAEKHGITKSNAAMGQEEDFEPVYSVDAYLVGNWTRFVNHHCFPNLQIMPTYIDEGNILRPLLALIAIRTIQPGEEINLSYFSVETPQVPAHMSKAEFIEEMNEVRKRARPLIRCHCGAELCRGIMFVNDVETASETEARAAEQAELEGKEITFDSPIRKSVSSRRQVAAGGSLSPKRVKRQVKKLKVESSSPPLEAEHEMWLVDEGFDALLDIDM